MATCCSSTRARGWTSGGPERRCPFFGTDGAGRDATHRLESAYARSSAGTGRTGRAIRWTGTMSFNRLMIHGNTASLAAGDVQRTGDSRRQRSCFT